MAHETARENEHIFPGDGQEDRYDSAPFQDRACQRRPDAAVRSRSARPAHRDAADTWRQRTGAVSAHALDAAAARQRDPRIVMPYYVSEIVVATETARNNDKDRSVRHPLRLIERGEAHLAD